MTSENTTAPGELVGTAIHWDRERALRLLKLVKTDRTADIPKRLCTPTGLPGVNE